MIQPPLAPIAPPPIENPVWNGWDVLTIASLTFVAMVVLQLGLVLVEQWLRYPHQSFVEVAQKVAQMPTLLLLSQFLIYAAVAACMIMTVEGKYRVPFWQAIRWNWPRSEWGLLGLGGVLFVGLFALENLLPMPKDTPFEHLFDRPRDAYLLSLIAVTLGPLMEELFFRGFLYPVLARRMGKVIAILLTSTLFGLLHGAQLGYSWAVLIIFLVGVVLTTVRAVTKSVASSFLVHVGYNATLSALLFIATSGFRHLERLNQ